MFKLAQTANLDTFNWSLEEGLAEQPKLPEKFLLLAILAP